VRGVWRYVIEGIQMTDDWLALLGRSCTCSSTISHANPSRNVTRHRWSAGVTRRSRSSIARDAIGCSGAPG